MKKPGLFIVGFPKSGTTALHYFLDQHPRIFMSNPKEVYHFCKDFIQEGYRYHSKKGSMIFFKNYFRYKDQKSYMNLFAKANDNPKTRYLGESSTYYLYSKVAAKEIHQFNKDARIIIMVREPVDFIYSYHSQLVFEFQDNIKDFSQAIGSQAQRKKGKRLPKRVPMPSLLQYYDHVKYKEQIERYTLLFPKKNIHFILYDDFKKDNKKVFDNTINFLGLDPTQIHFKEHNPNTSSRFSKVKYFFESPVFWKPIKKMISPKHYKVVRDEFYSIFMKETKRKGLDKKLKKELMLNFKPEVKKLAKIMNKDVVKLWGYDKI
jgi:hypothetical protein